MGVINIFPHFLPLGHLLIYNYSHHCQVELGVRQIYNDDNQAAAR